MGLTTEALCGIHLIFSHLFIASHNIENTEQYTDITELYFRVQHPQSSYMYACVHVHAHAHTHTSLLSDVYVYNIRLICKEQKNNLSKTRFIKES